MSKKYSSTFILSNVFVIAPFIAFAQQQDLRTIIDIVIGYLNRILVLMIGVAVVMFVYYIIKYFIKADAERKEAGPYVMWSLIGFFVILSLWGLVNILQNTFNLKNENNQPYSWTSFQGLFPGGGNSNGPSGSNQTNTAPFGSNQTNTAPLNPNPINPEAAP